MPEESDNQLKVCCTCSHWSFQHKGFCHRLEQGAGKFWMCEDWNPAATNTKESPSDARNTAQVGGTAA
jgi:hypothetical protein